MSLRLLKPRVLATRRAFSELVERYERKIYRLAKHITQNDEDAEDVLQESFHEGVHASGLISG